MRRAGGAPEDEPLPDDSTFVAAEDGTAGAVEPEDAAGLPPPPVDPPPPIRGELLPPPPSFVPTPMPATTIDMARGDAGEDIRLQEIVRVLKRRKWLMAGVMVAAIGAAMLYNHTATRVYEAQASVLIEPSAQEFVRLRDGQGQDLGRHDYFITQFEILRSRTLAEKTLDKLQLVDTDPARHAAQVGRLQSALTVTPRRSDMGDARVVNVIIRDSDPQRAAMLANGVADTYVEQNLEGMRVRTQQAVAMLNEELDKLRREVRARESALQDYREQRDAVSLESELNVIADSYKQLSADLGRAQVDRVQKETLYQQLQSLQRANQPLDTFPAIQSDPVIQAIKADLATLEREKTRLEAAGFLPGFPEMEKLNQSIRAANERLAAETRKLADRIANEARAARDTERELSAEVEKQKGAVLDLTRKSIAYNQLKNDATTTQQLFETVLTTFKETELASQLPSNNVKVLDRAQVPGAPILPRTQLNLMLAVLVGGFVAVGLAFGLEYTNPRLADPTDIAASLGLPLLGTTPKVSALGDGPAALGTLPVSFQEAIRNIRTQIFLSPLSAGARTLAVTSARPGEGKTVVSSSLAVSMAMAGRRVLLIDADLRRAQIRHVFNVPRAPGLSNIIQGEVKPSQALVESPVKGLFILPAGDEVPNPGDLLEGERLNQLIRGLRQVFDVVVIDCPPVMAVADASIVASAASSVVFVVGSGTTSRDVAHIAIDRLASVQARIVGVVLNKTKNSVHSEYYAPYYTAQDGVTSA